MVKNNKHDNTQYLTPSQAAERLMVSPVTLRHWALAGKLAYTTTPGGHRRFALDEVERFAAEFSAGTPATGESGRAAAGTEQRRILVVDDDRQLAGYLAELFSGLSESLVCEVAYDGFEAGRKMSEFSPDALLLDLMMPGLDGFQVCRAIKSDPDSRDTRVVVMTGYHTPTHVQQALDAGAEACLAKPLDRERLMVAMGLKQMFDEAAGRRTWPSEF